MEITQGLLHINYEKRVSGKDACRLVIKLGFLLGAGTSAGSWIGKESLTTITNYSGRRTSKTLLDGTLIRQNADPS